MNRLRFSLKEALSELTDRKFRTTKRSWRFRVASNPAASKPIRVALN